VGTNDDAEIGIFFASVNTQTMPSNYFRIVSTPGLAALSNREIGYQISFHNNKVVLGLGRTDSDDAHILFISNAGVLVKA